MTPQLKILNVIALVLILLVWALVEEGVIQYGGSGFKLQPRADYPVVDAKVYRWNQLTQERKE